MKKLKQLLIAVALLSTYSHATCSKQEVMKLIDKGFSKTEINSICDIQSKSATTTAKPKSKWITPSNATCRSKGGRLYKGICQANWQQAKSICRASGGRLPSKRELVAVISECGGNMANTHGGKWDESAETENKEDPNYQSCYKRKGFLDLDLYWSSSEIVSETKYAWSVYFKAGATNEYAKSNISYVRCVRARQ